ncbi:30S ribosomal protein S17 [Candidatus Berkelbacteria bacterium]|nr:30S ribosomal protein S17 [Candidatus Berkelbacteria bacterium]
MARKRRTGTVLAYVHPTARVNVARMARHPLYEKAYTVSGSYLVHVPAGQTVSVGSVVEIEETRPISRRKAWQLVRTVTEAAQ